MVKMQKNLTQLKMTEVSRKQVYNDKTMYPVHVDTYCNYVVL
jgi:hypothetical protein